MRLFLYYSLHAFKNQLKKLLKTWVLVFVLACFVLGGLIGLGAATLSSMAESQKPETVEEETEEPEKPPLLEKTAIIELVAGGVILALFAFEAISADKNGSRIFIPADVNLLFPSPMKPQSVLMFRLMTQLGLALAASVYMLFQIPNLTLNLGLGIWAALAVIGTWALLLILGKLIQVLLYTLASTRPGMKANIRRVVYLVLALIAAAYFVYWKKSGLSPLDAAQGFFNAPATRYIPLWGWLKGFMMFAVEGNTLASLLCLAAVIAAGVVLTVVIWNVKADFYEDAMAKSEETAAMLEKAQSEKSGGVSFGKRKKDRSEKLRRDGMTRGAGANVFFYKSLYNRFRFAHFGFLTKTAETYLLAAAAVALLCRFVFEIDGLIPVALVLSGFAFFRSLGNPLEQDTKMDFFRLIPENTWSKLFFSLLGGTVNCLLDILPALVLAVILLPANPLLALAWIPFIVSIDFYATTVGAFINLSVPVSAGKTLKQFVQILFIYFGLIPDVAIMAVGLVMKHTAVAAIAAAALNVALGFLFLALCPHFIDPLGGVTARGGASEAKPAETGVHLGIARRNFSRLGGGLFLYQAVYLVIAIVVSGVLTALAPNWTETAWFWVVNFAPQYLIALPLGMLLIRRAPYIRIRPEKLGAAAWIKALLVCVFLMIAGNLLGQFVTSVLGTVIGHKAKNPLESLLVNDSLALRILVAVLIGPLVEEFIFRKQMISRMHAYGEKLAVVSSAALFALFHGNLSQAFYAFLLGLVFGYVYLRSGRIWYSYGLHVCVNFFGGVVGPYFAEKAGALSELTLGSVDMASVSELVSPGLVALGIYEILLFGMAIVGLILLCINAKSLRFAPAALELPRGARFKTAWVNVGMILFVLISLGLIGMTLFS